MSNSYEAFSTNEPITDQDRFKVLEDCMNQYGDEIKRVVFSYVKNHSDTDDITQDVFVKVYEKLDQFKGDSTSTLKSWIYRIAINKSKDHLRSFTSKQKFLKEKVTQLRDHNEQKTPEDHSIQQESSNLLLNEIYQLPLKYREIIILYYFEELTLQEISEALGMNLNTTKARLRRGRERLKPKLKALGGDELG